MRQFWNIGYGPEDHTKEGYTCKRESAAKLYQIDSQRGCTD